MTTDRRARIVGGLLVLIGLADIAFAATRDPIGYWHMALGAGFAFSGAMNLMGPKGWKRRR